MFKIATFDGARGTYFVTKLVCLALTVTVIMRARGSFIDFRPAWFNNLLFRQEWVTEGAR